MSILYGHRGQGVETATRILGRAMFAAKMHVRDFVLKGFQYDVPVTGFVKADKSPILSNQTESADILLVLNTKLDYEALVKNAKKSAIVIFNSPNHVNNKILKKLKIKSFFVDALSIGLDTTKRPYPNTAMLGALAKVMPKISLKQLKAATVIEIPQYAQINQAVIDEGFKNIKRN